MTCPRWNLCFAAVAAAMLLLHPGITDEAAPTAGAAADEAQPDAADPEAEADPKAEDKKPPQEAWAELAKRKTNDNSKMVGIHAIQNKLVNTHEQMNI